MLRFFLIFLSLSAGSAAFAEDVEAIVARDTPLMDAPGPYTQIGVLRKGMRISVSTCFHQGDWCHVSKPEGVWFVQGGDLIAVGGDKTLRQIEAAAWAAAVASDNARRSGKPDAGEQLPEAVEEVAHIAPEPEKRAPFHPGSVVLALASPQPAVAGAVRAVAEAVAPIVPPRPASRMVVVKDVAVPATRSLGWASDPPASPVMSVEVSPSIILLRSK